MSAPTARRAVIVTVDADAEALPALLEHARFGLERFPEFPGFASGALHQSADGTRLVQYLLWESEAEYRACVDDPRWDEYPSTARFAALVASGTATMDVRVYEVVTEAAPA